MTANAHRHHSVETEIQRLEGMAEAEICARMMANSEPWITLHRDYDASLKILIDPEREVYLAMEGREIIGFTIINMHGAFVGYIQSVCVAPQWRGKGFGSKLMDYVEKRILSETPNVFICVSSFNQRVQKLYERRGYEVIGELKNFIIRGHSEVLLRKTIAPLNEFKKQQLFATLGSKWYASRRSKGDNILVVGKASGANTRIRRDTTPHV